MAISDLFKNVNIFGAGLPAGSGGLLTKEQQEQLANQSLVQGLLGTAASYLAQPKTGRYGSALPYLGKAYLGGMQASQGAYDTALNRAFQAKALQGKDQQLYNVDGALVDRQGNVVYQSPIKASQGEGPFAKIPMANVDTEQSNLPEFVKRYNAGDPTAYDFLVMKKEKEPILTKGEQIKKELTPLQLKIDEKFAPDLVEFTVGGGFSGVQKNLIQLGQAKEALENAPEGSITGKLVGVQNDAGVLKFSNPDAENVKEKVQEIVQRNLKLILGAQFAQKEGEQLISRAYNPALPQSVNIQRLNLLQEQILNAAKAKQEAVDYYNEYGTLAGFKGKLYDSTTEFLDDYSSKINEQKKPEQSKTITAPQTGTVMNGFRFKGGDPSKQENWEKI